LENSSRDSNGRSWHSLGTSIVAENRPKARTPTEVTPLGQLSAALQALRSRPLMRRD